MKEFKYVITDNEGIHARPAGLLVKKAKEFASAVTLKKGEQSGDAKKIFSVMGLAAKKGEEIVVTVDGADEDTAAPALEAFFKENL
ncbi:HPr family phosphocarrier protein [Clostridium sp. D33t1_170424_F3]|uniref:HPr family phosphocarrier protein n=1 Tax=Clostridium sp. D33t1_170424_F3 TaxID=2787099 RepID=UPI0018AA32B4|nr:HPr family phosphocarrier protein [Clostridium sp. D33t1_170424_F3]